MWYSKTVNYNREVVKTHKEVALENDELTIDYLKKYVGDNKFSFFQDVNEKIMLCWCEFRDETDAEMNARIAKDEAYNVLAAQKRAEVGRK